MQRTGKFIVFICTKLVLIVAQLIWLVSELVHREIHDADTLCIYLLRYIASGDLSPRNVWLAQTMLQLFTDNK